MCKMFGTGLHISSYFSSTILMDVGKLGSDNLGIWMREELTGHPPMSPVSLMV